MGSLETPEGLTKIYVELPNHPSVAGESMWAREVGQNRYELRNIPFHAYALNFLDVVEAVAGELDERPVVRRLIRRSGHQTLRICFDESALLEERVPLLRQLGSLGASFEGASQSYYAIDVAPGGNYPSVLGQLRGWQEAGMLSFETGDARAPGSFDDLPAV
jgi:hypothetical protein